MAPTQPHSSPPPPPSSVSPVSQVTGLNTTLNVSIQRVNLDAQQCSQRRCSGNGHCVETKGVTTCVCSLGYSGDSCENHAGSHCLRCRGSLCSSCDHYCNSAGEEEEECQLKVFCFFLYLNLKFNFFLSLSLSVGFGVGGLQDLATFVPLQ